MLARLLSTLALECDCCKLWKPFLLILDQPLLLVVVLPSPVVLAAGHPLLLSRGTKRPLMQISTNDYRRNLFHAVILIPICFYDFLGDMLFLVPILHSYPCYQPIGGQDDPLTLKTSAFDRVCLLTGRQVFVSNEPTTASDWIEPSHQPQKLTSFSPVAIATTNVEKKLDKGRLDLRSTAKAWRKKQAESLAVGFICRSRASKGNVKLNGQADGELHRELTDQSDVLDSKFIISFAKVVFIMIVVKEALKACALASIYLFKYFHDPVGFIFVRTSPLMAVLLADPFLRSLYWQSFQVTSTKCARKRSAPSPPLLCSRLVAIRIAAPSDDHVHSGPSKPQLDPALEVKGTEVILADKPSNRLETVDTAQAASGGGGESRLNQAQLDALKAVDLDADSLAVTSDEELEELFNELKVSAANKIKIRAARKILDEK
eukprot:g388.t1